MRSRTVENVAPKTSLAFNYAIAPDGESFVMVEPDAESHPRRIRVVLGWREEVERRLAAAERAGR